MNQTRTSMSIHNILTTDNELSFSPSDSYKSMSPSPVIPYQLPSPTLSSSSLSSIRTSDYHHDIRPYERRNSHPMPLEERRYRNKIASAKYRAKKQQNMKSMTSRISQLLSNNEMLQQELTKVNKENEQLRSLCRSIMFNQTNTATPHKNYLGLKYPLK